MNLNLTIKEMTLTGMCAALMAIFSQLSIPLPFTPVPVTLQILGLTIIAIVFGAKIATLSIIVFIILGAIGLPVFASFSGGLGVIAGPSGGYIIGYIFMAFLVGYASYTKNKIVLSATSYIGLSIVYMIGTLQLKTVTGLSLQASLAAGVYPFILKDLIIVALSIVVGLNMKSRLKNIIIKNVTA